MFVPHSKPAMVSSICALSLCTANAAGLSLICPMVSSPPPPGWRSEAELSGCTCPPPLGRKRGGRDGSLHGTIPEKPPPNPPRMLILKAGRRAVPPVSWRAAPAPRKGRPAAGAAATATGPGWSELEQAAGARAVSDADTEDTASDNGRTAGAACAGSGGGAGTGEGIPLDVGAAAGCSPAPQPKQVRAAHGHAHCINPAPSLLGQSPPSPTTQAPSPFGGRSSSLPHPASRSHWPSLRPPRSPIGRIPQGRAHLSHPAPPLAAARALLGARDKMAALPEPLSRGSRLPVRRAQEKRAPSEGPPAAPPQQKRSRTGLGPGDAKAAPKAPLRAPLRTLGRDAAAGENGSVTSMSSKGASKRPPWDLRGQLGDLREALGQAQEQLQGLDSEKRELESGNRQLRERLERLERLQRELGERESRESSLCTQISSLELEVSQCRKELQQIRGRVEALEAEEQQLQAQEQQWRQERDKALGRAQELAEQLENAMVVAEDTFSRQEFQFLRREQRQPQHQAQLGGLGLGRAAQEPLLQGGPQFQRRKPRKKWQFWTRLWKKN
ncbi:uncharacterized protein LOC141728077 isoform X2 [Zonotrichia albicollis]|uniref:uncharacterized protein LOC141728077 isoform X2 n=2 Tax=Zonotrichia albicollis TaxID=44394 RepID=UPI003D811CDC